MAYNYDALYAKDPHALGDQTPVIAAFIAGLGLDRARILDVGCGQGRDALPLARAGHDVTGVDLSPRGVAAMLAEAKTEGLSIIGHVADITTFQPDGLFDLVLADRTLHMLDAAPRAATFQGLIDCLRPFGWLIVADEAGNLAGFRSALETDRRPWSIERCDKGLLFAQAGG